jgi:hypothetical protein
MRRFAIPTFIAIVAVIVFGSAPPAAAIEYPWCAQYSGGEDGGGRNCGFSTLEQCRATVSGIGGSCEPNLFYESQPAAAPGRKQKKRDG